ncbi:HDOD domain-containing protein [Rhodopirellula sallentina]|uniref:Signal transduction response regulator, receiver region domain protein n=1 Tax=Rhodopirellula sallentina SM41 TaxID=1263870 RepID=M5U6V1_9BACT|nr:HDOD domain-containing protein [Rhodopirellula sallentina]EMI57160.1 Signal transduction response regulator, receiver region domain protein [Rhodopirellula sallentina SM41]
MSTTIDQQDYHALVVDDDPIVRRMVSFALAQEGFHCRSANDGQDALSQLSDYAYDLLVTDLRMPKKHGHSLAVDVLSQGLCPTIIVHTSVGDARLTKDLIIRGVHDVVYKPTDYETFAAKAKGLVVRERKQNLSPPPRTKPTSADSQQIARTKAPPPPAPAPESIAESIAEPAPTRTDNEPNTPTQPEPATASPPTAATKNERPKPDGCAPIEMAEMQDRLTDVSKVLPISHAAVDVANMAVSGNFDADRLVAAMQRDSTVESKILQLANHPFYNPGGKRVRDIKQAVLRMGQKRTGELVLATSAFSSIKPDTLPWMDVELTWQQSVAAGIALELLIKAGMKVSVSEGMLFSTLMNSAGRVVLGSHYPEYYESMAKACAKYSQPLMMYEEQLFPQSYAEVMCGLLADWDIPKNVFDPLQHILEPYSALAKLPDPMRTKVELVKLATLIGHIAVGRWEPWEMVELPRNSVYERLGITSISQVIEDTRSQLPGIPCLRNTEGHLSNGQNTPSQAATDQHSVRKLDYINLSDEKHDFLADIVSSMGIQLEEHHFKQGKGSNHVLINRIGAEQSQKKCKIVASVDCDTIVIVRDSLNDAIAPALVGPGLELPCSFARLQSACLNAATTDDKTAQPN